MSTAIVSNQRRVYPLETERGSYAVMLTILTESFLFIALFASYFFLGNNKKRWQIEELPKLHYAIPMLFVLIASSLVLYWGSSRSNASGTGLVG